MNNWCVDVQCNKESVLKITHNSISGRSELTTEEKTAIETAARNMLGFLGKHYGYSNFEIIIGEKNAT